MKFKCVLSYCLLSALFCVTACTNLDEDIYSQIVTENYYQDKEDVIAAVVRPFEHGSWTIIHRFTLNEQTSDQLGTWNREGWWVDNGIWQKLHYHTWDFNHKTIKEEWVNCFQGVTLTNSVIDDLSALDPQKFGFSDADFDALIAQSRTLRAWFYIRLLDAYRNIPLATSKDFSKNSIGQVAPEVMFNFIESELKDALDKLPVKAGNQGNGVNQGVFNKAGAASLLVRLYLNAEKWIEKPMYNECAAIAQRILDGEFGFYELEKTWDKVFDWTNDQSNEIIFGFPSSFSGKHWQYTDHMYWWCVPRFAHYYFGSVQQGVFNPKYGLQPSFDVEGNPYPFTLGRPVAKYKKYPEDYRLKMYRNLGNSTREGMMLFGYLEYVDQKTGEIKKVTSPVSNQPIYLRDQVGDFVGVPPGGVPNNKTSDMTVGEHGSGWQFVKYPIYGDEDAGKQEADYAEIRLAEIYYSLAECKFRNGDIDEAAVLLNQVRKRNYPVEYHSEYLYVPEGKAVLTQEELIDEWGREFLGEGRRRTDLCRWNLFSTGTWWDKTPDPDNHTDIMPIHKDLLGADLSLVQNPGYEQLQQ